MDISKIKNENSTDEASKCIPVLSEYAKALKGRVNERYLQKISAIGVDPASIPTDQFSPECFPPVEVSDLVSYLVLKTSYYTRHQFKALKSLEAFDQMVSGFVTSVVGKLIAGKYVVRARVRHTTDEWSFGEHLDYHRTGCDCLVGPLLRIQSWTSGIVLTYRECSILFGGHYTTSWQACLYSSKMFMDLTHECKWSAVREGHGH